MDELFNYSDPLSIQFMARLLQLKRDRKDDEVAVNLVIDEFWNQMEKDCTGNDIYIFLDGSKLEYFGNNRWECSKLNL